MQPKPSILEEAYQCSAHGTAARIPFRNRGTRFLTGLGYCVVHASALYAFLTFAMATSGLGFFYFYPREAQTLLGPFALDAMVWLGTAIFSVLGLTLIGLRDTGSRGGRKRRRHFALAIGAWFLLTLLVVLASPSLVPFWWIGTGALGICWVGFGPETAQVIGGRRELLKSFFASLLGIGAILETWSLGYWLGSGVVPAVAFDKVGADLEMNLTYATSMLMPVIFVTTWLSPVWAYIALGLYRRLKRSKSATSASPKIRETRLGLDDLILTLVIILICVLVGFYAYSRDPPWLVGTDAYWRYDGPLERVTSSGNILAAAANERHGLYILILYGVHSATGLSPFNIIKATPVVLASSLSILTYLGVAHYRRSRTEGFFASLFSATTFPTTLGIFASIDANWFAMIIAVVTVFVLSSFGQSPRDMMGKGLLVAFCGVLLLLLHPWTWGIMAFSTLFAGLIFLIRRNWRMFGASLIVPLCGLASGMLVFMIGSETERAKLLEALWNFAAPLSESQVLSPFGVINDSFRIWAPFLNPLLAILTIVGAIVLTHEKPSGYEIIVLSWMLVTGVGTFFAVTLQTEIWRIWYLQPLWLVAAAGMSGLLKVADSAADLAKSNAENVMVAGLILLGGLTVLILQPILGSWIFYVVTALPAVFNFRRCKTSTILATSLILFVSLFFVNHALRSLFPLFLDPHNFREH